MKDLFNSYHRHKVLANIGVLSLSTILAISINMTLLGGQTGQHFKANVLEATTSQKDAVDFLAQVSDTHIIFSNSYSMQNVSGISFSLAYNPDLLELDENNSNYNSELSTIKNESGFRSYIINLKESQSYNPREFNFSLPYKKNGEETVHLNIINVNFTDIDGNVFSLTTEGIMF